MQYHTGTAATWLQMSNYDTLLQACTHIGLLLNSLSSALVVESRHISAKGRIFSSS